MSPKASPPGNVTPKQFARLRKQMGMSQEELARELGVSIHTISRYERGALAIPRKIEMALHYLLSRKGARQ